MSPSRTFLVLLTTILITASAAFAQQPTIVNFDFGAVPIACENGYAYQIGITNCGRGLFPMQNFNATPGFGWTLWQMPALEVGGAGLTGPSSAFCPPSFAAMPFTQAVFLQNRGSFVRQAVAGFTAGNYTLSFYLGGRCGWGPQKIAAMIDGNVIGTWTVQDGTPFTLETAPFTVSTNGTHTLEFMGLNFGDHTAFLSYVVITPTER